MASQAPEPSSATLSELVVLAGSANPALGARIARELGAALGGCTVERFPDGEIHVEVDARCVEGRYIVVVQPTSNIASDHLLELLLIADACRRSGAMSVSAIVPYFGYARQDRRKEPGEPLGVAVVAQILGTAQFETIVVVDLHSDVTEASLEVPVEHLTAVPLLAEALQRQTPREAVVVAPDVGAVRLAREYSRLLRLPLAVVHKVRRSDTHVDVELVAGDVRGLHPILVDDMIATGGTIVAAARALQAEGAQRTIAVAATHAVLTPGTMDRLRETGLHSLIVTDTIAQTLLEPSAYVISVAPLLAACVRRLVMRRHVSTGDLALTTRALPPRPT
jgi:ribose-phosphate pyrophosphokinase